MAVTCFTALLNKKPRSQKAANKTVHNKLEATAMAVLIEVLLELEKQDAFYNIQLLNLDLKEKKRLIKKKPIDKKNLIYLRD